MEEFGTRVVTITTWVCGSGTVFLISPFLCLECLHTIIKAFHGIFLEFYVIVLLYIYTYTNRSVYIDTHIYHR